ncbi:nucleoprotein TPR-like [Ceratina calcarata]|uniref:Nucleoprotein TPR-like n=1 Tax=Ceratina calcarata TaxID=156304 RepID=A0AAJ7IYB0_9HYME|nr:nucleoprotein TPR-like [Ceratina calcarata]
MAGTDYVIAPQIPRGLAPAIEGLAREILRKRPRDIYTFAARHFEQLVKLRDKECGVKPLDRKSYKNDYVFDWIDRNDVETQKRIIKDLRKYTHSLNEDAIAKGQRMISTMRQGKPRRREKEILNESGWSINRTVKVFKEYEGQRENVKTRTNGRSTKKLVREPHVSGIDSKRVTLSGNTLKNIKRPVDKLYRSVGEECGQGRVSSNNLKRQRSADQIEASENAALFVDRRRSRSLANNEDRNENARRRCAEELPGSWKEEAAVKLNLRSDKKNGEEPKDRGEKYTVESRSNNVFDQAIVNVTTVVSVVLPSVVTRQSSANSVRSEVHESNDECKSSLVLPPITVDPCKSVKKESNLTLPSLSNEADGRPTSSCEDGSSLDPKEKESTNLGAELVNKEEIVRSWEHLNKCEETVDKDKLDETQHRTGVVKNLLEVEADEHFQDSLNVTPDPIDNSQRADSLEQIETENKDEPELEEGANELKRKLIEIETVEKSIENALASSRSNVSFDHEIQATDIEQEKDSSLHKEKEIQLDDKADQIKEDEDETKSDSAKEKGSNKENEEEIEEVLEVPITSDVDTNILKESVNESVDDPSCYVLKEGSPCKIPESVTTVIIPDQVPNEIEDLNAIDDLNTLGESENYQHDERFGEYIGPEAHDYPSEVDAHFLRDVKNTSYQNLGNIKEEEESNDFANKHDFDLLSSRTVESVDEDSVESEEKSSDLKQTSTDNVKEDKSLQTSIKTVEKETLDDRSSDLSLSLEKSEPQIPELNLDSLQDLTVSSFERNDSKNLETEKENDSTTVYEEENGTLSSSDNSSERKSSGKVQPREDEEKSESQNKLVNDVIRDETVQTLEEEIAKELIQNFIHDESIHKTSVEEEVSGANIEESDDTKKVEELSQELINAETVSRENTEVDNEKTEEEKIEEIESGGNKMGEISENSDLCSESKIVEPIEEYSHRAVIEESVEGGEKEIEVEERAEVQIEELKDEEEKDKERIEETSEASHDGQQRYTNYRHTGEFHDSIPLPLIEFPRLVYRRTSMIDNEENASVPSMSSLDSNPELTVPYIIDLLGKYRSLDKKPSLAGFINISPYIIRFENVLHEPQTVDKPVVSTAETSSSFSSDTDDLREPLALDNTPQPVIIEEITNDDEEKEGSRVTSQNEC